MKQSIEMNPDLYLAHGDYLRRLLRGLLFDEHEVEDVVQETWLRAMESPPRSSSAWRSWLTVVASNFARNRSRADRRRRTREEGRAVAESIPSSEELVAREELRRKIVEACLDLEEPYRSVVFLRYFEELPAIRIAQKLSIPAATVRTRLRRGLARLRERLDSEHGGDRRSWSLALIPMALPRGGALLSPQLMGVARRLLWLLPMATIAALLTLWASGAFDSMSVPAQSGLLAEAESEETEVSGLAASRVEEQRSQAATSSKWGTADRSAFVGFRGRIASAAGQALAGVHVRILAIDPVSYLHEAVDPLVARAGGDGFVHVDGQSDASGRFEIRGLPPRAVYVLSAQDARSGDRVLRVLEQTPPPGRVRDLGGLRLLRTGFARGRVVDEAGKPLANVLVWSLDLPMLLLEGAPLLSPSFSGTLILRDEAMNVVGNTPAWLRSVIELFPIAQAKTDVDGKFELRGLVPGRHTIVLEHPEHPGLLRGGIRVMEGQEARLPRLRLKTGRPVRGRVVDEAGQAIPHAELCIATASFFDSLGYARESLRCDAEGRFESRALRAGYGIFAARRGPRHAWTVSKRRRLAREHELVVPPLRRLEVVVSGLAKGAASSLQMRMQIGRIEGEALSGRLLPGLVARGRKIAAGRFVFERPDAPGRVRIGLRPLEHIVFAREEIHAFSVVG